MSENATKLNKGEWSELYAFLKVLADKKLFIADEDLHKQEDRYLTILALRRGNFTYHIIEDTDGNHIRIFDDDEKRNSIDIEYLENKTEALFQKIKTDKLYKNDPLVEEIKERFYLTSFKAPASKKSDLIVKIRDRILSESPWIGFSVKSQIGSPSTLLNASQATNFVYKISENSSYPSYSTETFSVNDKVPTLKEQVKNIEYGTQGLEFHDVKNEVFKRNLKIIDTNFPTLLAELIKAFYGAKGASSGVSDLVNYLDENGILEEKLGLDKEMYEYKIKQFLMEVALGMNPGTKWHGHKEAYGGYIIVKEEGEIVCYHLYNQDQFQEYLFNNTQLEKPSQSKHQYGEIYTGENNERLMDLNLQIRFIK